MKIFMPAARPDPSYVKKMCRHCPLVGSDSVVETLMATSGAVSGGSFFFASSFFLSPFFFGSFFSGGL
jgi:hypothetical protein